MTAASINEAPRRSRHAASVAVLAGVIAVLVACGNSPDARSAQHSSTQAAAIVHRLSFGMTKKQVVRILGRPKTIRGTYWYWPVVNGKLAGKPLVTFDNNKPFVFGARIDLFRIQFSYGVVQNEEVRFLPPHGHKVWDAVNI